MKYFLAAIVLMWFAVPARAQIISNYNADGNWLLGSCQLSVQLLDHPKVPQNNLESWRDGYCRGIVRGVASVSRVVCGGDNVTHSQEVRVVVKYLQDHPQQLNVEGGLLIQMALAKAFLCKKIRCPVK